MAEPQNARTDPESGLRYYRFDDRELISVTSMRRVIGMNIQLHQWVLNEVIDGVLDNPHLADGLTTARVIRKGNESDAEYALRIRKEARRPIRAYGTLRRDEAAALGTGVHEAAEAGVKPDLMAEDDPRRPFLVAYQQWQKDTQPTILLQEQQVFNLTEGYAGSIDLVADIDTRRFLIDLKTGSGIYLDHVVQLMLYFGAEFVGGYDPLTDADEVYRQETSLFLGTTDIAILHLRPEGYEFIPIPITDEAAAASLDMVRFSRFLAKYADLPAFLKGVTP